MAKEPEGKKPKVVVIDADKKQGREFCALLQGLNYRVTLINSLEGLAGQLQKSSEMAVILDLDTVPLEKQSFRAFRKTYPDLHILGVSALKYHPGLEEVIATLCACLTKPLDMEELHFWLASIAENLSNPILKTEI